MAVYHVEKVFCGEDDMDNAKNDKSSTNDSYNIVKV